MTYEELTQALAELGLPQRARWEDIQQRYRDLARQCHPDTGHEADAERMQRLNAAYGCLESYCRQYCYRFDYEEFCEQQPEERLRQQFDNFWP